MALGPVDGAARGERQTTLELAGGLWNQPRHGRQGREQSVKIPLGVRRGLSSISSSMNGCWRPPLGNDTTPLSRAMSATREPDASTM